MRLRLLAVFILLVSRLAAADVLFLDLNDSAKEVEAARRAAALRKERLIVVPSLSPKQRENIDRLQTQVRRAQSEYERCAARGGASCDRLTGRVEDLNSKLDEARPLFDKELLSETLDKVSKDKARVSSVVISGHDGGGSFTGVYGSLSDLTLAEALESHPVVKDSLRSLHLWGCYTTNIGSIEMNWKRSFPNIALITGYNGTAPLNDKPAGWTYLEGVLSKEKELIEAGDAKKLKKLFDSIEGIGLVKAAICVNETYVTKEEAVPLSEMYARCRDLLPKALEQYKTFQCFLYASEERCENPPDDTQSGPLRAFYNTLQASRHCSETEDFADEFSDLPSTDHVIRVIHTKNLKNNFAKQFGQQIIEVDRTLHDLRAPSEARFSGIDRMTRGELLRKMQTLKEFLDKKAGGNDPDDIWNVTDEAAKVASLRHFVDAAHSIVIEPDPNCVPFSWVEPAAREYSCMGSDAFGDLKLAEYRVGPDIILQARVLQRKRANVDRIYEIDSQSGAARRELPAARQIERFKLEAENELMEAELRKRSIPYQVKRLENEMAEAVDDDERGYAKERIKLLETEAASAEARLAAAQARARQARLYEEINKEERPDMAKVLELRELSMIVRLREMESELSMDRAQPESRRVMHVRRRHEITHQHLELTRLRRQQLSQRTEERTARIREMESDLANRTREVAAVDADQRIEEARRAVETLQLQREVLIEEAVEDLSGTSVLPYGSVRAR